jgi:hypothetical protein
MHQTVTADNKDHDTVPESILCDVHHGQLETEVSAAQSRRILLKIDSVVLPLIVVSMTLAFLDKVIDSFALPTLIHTYHPLEWPCICSSIWFRDRHTSGRAAVQLAGKHLLLRLSCYGVPQSLVNHKISHW